MLKADCPQARPISSLVAIPMPSNLVTVGSLCYDGKARCIATVAKSGPGTAAPPSTVNTTTRLARLHDWGGRATCATLLVGL
jgi:hypothetical protein